MIVLFEHYFIIQLIIRRWWVEANFPDIKQATENQM